jgi:hypothetical protein
VSPWFLLRDHDRDKFKYDDNQTVLDILYIPNLHFPLEVGLVSLQVSSIDKSKPFLDVTVIPFGLNNILGDARRFGRFFGVVIMSMMRHVFSKFRPRPAKILLV